MARFLAIEKTQGESLMGTTDENFSSEMMPSDYVPNM